MTTTTTTTSTSRWLTLAELSTHLGVEPNKLGSSSRKNFRWIGLDTIEFYLDDGITIRKFGRYTQARYKVIST